MQEFEDKYKLHGPLSNEEQYALLESLWKSANASKTILFCLALLDTSKTDSVAFLPDVDDLPNGISSYTCKITIPHNMYGAVDVSHGTPFQWIFGWPHKKRFGGIVYYFLTDTFCSAGNV